MWNVVWINAIPYTMINIIHIGVGDGVGDGGMSVAVSLSDAILESDSTALLSLIVVRPALDGSSRSPVFAAETVGAGICIYESDSGLHACKVRY